MKTAALIAVLALSNLPVHAQTRTEKQFCALHPGGTYLIGQRAGYCLTSKELLAKPHGLKASCRKVLTACKPHRREVQ